MSKYIGDVSAYAYAVSKGYTGTEEEFAELMADYADVGQRAEDAAESALNSKTAAQSAATTATTKAGEASASATSASGSATAASASASAASGSATSAANSATAASGSATAAAGSATTASTKASEAAQSEANTVIAKNAAEAAQTAAEAAQGKAEDARDAAETTAQSISASAAQIATNAADIAELKSEVSALPTDGVVANSKQLLSENGTDNTEPYTFRAVSVNADRAELDAVVGGTVAWNQLAYNGDFASLDGWGDPNVPYRAITLENGRAKISHITSNYMQFITNETSYNKASVKAGHKYLALCNLESNSTITTVNYVLNANWTDLGYARNNTNSTKVSFGGIINATGDTANNFRITITVIGSFTDGTTYVYCDNVQLFDLTAMFGSTIADYIYSLEQSTAGAGVAFFRKLFPADYYPYDAGTLKSVEGVSSHDTVGFNQWDEEWERASIDWHTYKFTPTGSGGRLASKNFIPVLCGKTYYVTRYANNILAGYADKNSNGINISNNSGVFTVPDGIHFIKFGVEVSTYGTTYNHDICINLSDPVKNGQYEPYVKHSYPLDSDVTLRGIPKLADGKLSYDGDRYLPDGTVERRYGIVDLGSLTWVINGTETSDKKRMKAVISGLKQANSSTSKANLICSKYTNVSGVDTYSLVTGVCASHTEQAIFIYDPNYDTSQSVADFKTALSGVYLVYELATPTTETADSYQSLQVCDPNGTEEFVTTGIVPVGHETRYPENLRAKIEGLPWDFSSIIAPTEKTTTASRNYTTGALLIMNNVLYKVTANIANGGTITPNTNVTATTLSEVISALQ